MSGEPSTQRLPWRRFPTGRARNVANRWLDRRRALLFVGWFALVLLPSLTVIYWGARFGVAGVPLIVVAVAFGLLGSVTAMGTLGGWRELINQASAVDEHTLVVRYASGQTRKDLHVGVVHVLKPGWRRGRAHVLAVDLDPKRRPQPWLLLSSPATGELRDARDLRQLADALCASPMESDREAGQIVLSLSARATLAAGEPGGVQWEPEDLPRSVWSALKAFGRTLALLLVIVAILGFAGAVESWRKVDDGNAVANATVYLLMYSAAGLGGPWLLYFLFRLRSLVVVTWSAAAARLPVRTSSRSTAKR